MVAHEISHRFAKRLKRFGREGTAAIREATLARRAGLGARRAFKAARIGFAAAKAQSAVTFNIPELFAVGVLEFSLIKLFGFWVQKYFQRWDSNILLQHLNHSVTEFQLASLTEGTGRKEWKQKHENFLGSLLQYLSYEDRIIDVETEEAKKKLEQYAQGNKFRRQLKPSEFAYQGYLIDRQDSRKRKKLKAKRQDYPRYPRIKLPKLLYESQTFREDFEEFQEELGNRIAEQIYQDPRLFGRYGKQITNQTFALMAQRDII